MASRSTAGQFSFGVRLGLVFIVESASISALAVTLCLLYILFSAFKVNPGTGKRWTFSTQIHWYFLCLLISDLIQSIGSIISVRWIMIAGIQEGSLCTAQGLLKQMGNVGVALTSMVIGLHTFFVLGFHCAPHRLTAVIVVSLIWIFIALNVGISMATHKGQHYYGNTQYWCWITGRYSVQRIVLEYLWLWMACFVNIIIYVLLFLIVKGIVVVENLKIRIPSRKDRVSSRLAASGGGAGAVALQLLYYPAVYIITVLPVSIARWYGFTGETVPFAATAFASVLFSSSGLLNVILFKVTRPKLLSSSDSPIPASTPYFPSARSLRSLSASYNPGKGPRVSDQFDWYSHDRDALQASLPGRVRMASSEIYPEERGFQHA